MSSGSSAPRLEELAANGAAPGERQSRQRELARQAARSPAAAPAGRHRLSTPVEEMILLVDVADRADDGQDRRLAAEPLDEHLAEGADGAAGGQEDGDVGERQRIAAVGSGDQAAGEERIGERRAGTARRPGW